MPACFSFQSFTAELRKVLGVTMVGYAIDFHTLALQAILQRLLENALFVKAEKCEFHGPSISFLGYVVGRGVLKVSAVTTWSVP